MPQTQYPVDGNTAIQFPPEHIHQAEEIQKSYKSFLYFCSSYCYIQDRRTKQAIQFNLWPGQQKVLPLILSTLFLIALKARQVGITWLIAAYALWRAIFHFHEFIIIISAKEDLAIEFLDRVKFVFDRLPDWLKPKVMRRGATELSFGVEKKDKKGNIKIEGLNSVIKSIPSTPDAGQSKTITLLVMDESALNRYCSEIWSAALPTLEHSDGQAIVISNPNKDKPGWGWTRDLYTDSMKGLNKFKRFFLDWRVVPGRGENFIALQKDAGLSDTDIAMQYPSSEKEALEAASGGYFKDTLIRFEPIPPDATGYLKKKSEKGQWIFEAERNGILTIWDHPQKHWENRYAIGSDVSEGLGETYSVAYVYDRIDNRYIARLRSNQIDADVWAERLIELGQYYNNAMIAVERNGAGITTVVKLQNSYYPHLFYRKRPGKLKGQIVYEYGWQETNENKQILADELRRYFREIFTAVPCAVLIDEASTFIRHETGQLGHENGKLDDCVIAAGITLQASIMMPPPKNISPRARLSTHDRRIDRLEQGNIDSYEQYAAREQELELRRLQGSNIEWGDLEEYEDGSGKDMNLKRTI